MTAIDTERLLALVRDGYTNAQLADAFGCTVRTIDRRRAADPALSQAIITIRAEIAAASRPDHGTHRRYAIGCRCEPCTAANTLRCYEERMGRRARLGMPPPNPNRGRPRSTRQVSRPRVLAPLAPTLIAQAIARGESTSRIMRQLACDYDAIQAVRDDMARLEQESA